MSRWFVWLLLLVPVGLSAGCPHTSMNWVKVETCPPVRSPEQVEVLYTKRAIPHPYKVVARYRVSSTGEPMPTVLRKIVTRAAKDGSHAVLIERGFGASSTVWSWVLLFIPVTEHATLLEVAALRYLPPGGAP